MPPTGPSNLFTLSFSGICAFLAKDNETTESVLVVLPDACAHIPQHRPLLAVPARHVAPVSAPATGIIEFPESGAKRSALNEAQGKVDAVLTWDLTGCRLRFLPGGYQTEEPMSAAFTNLPSFDGVVDDPTFDAALLQGIGAGRPVGAVALLEGGTIDTWKASPEEWQFVLNSMPKSDRMVISDGVRVVMTSSQPFVIVELRSHAGTRYITIVAENQEMIAAISNFPLNTEDQKHSATLPHAEAYYDLLKLKPSPIGRAILMLAPPKSGTAGAIVESSRCKPSARLKAPGGAFDMWNATTSSAHGSDGSMHEGHSH